VRGEDKIGHFKKKKEKRGREERLTERKREYWGRERRGGSEKRTVKAMPKRGGNFPVAEKSR